MSSVIFEPSGEALRIGISVEVQVIRKTGCMGQALMGCDFRRVKEVVEVEVGDIVDDFGVHIEASVFDEGHGCCGGAE